MALPRIRLPSLRTLDLDRGEAVLFASMCILVGALFGAHTLAKVLRDSLFLSEYGARALPIGYILVALFSVAFVGLEPHLARRWSRLDVGALSQFVAIAAALVAALLYPLGARWLPGAFYVWSGTHGVLLLAHFWLLALEVWDGRRARRLFPLMSGAGLLGGLAAGAFASRATSALGVQGLLWSLVALLVGARAVAMYVETRRRRRPLAAQVAATGSSWNVVARSSFLRALVAAIALSVVVGTLVDFQFKFLAQTVFPGRRELAGFLGSFYAWLNALALLVQFGAAGWILRRFGLARATGLQPALTLVLAVVGIVVPGWALAATMRWTQGVVFQTVGKSSNELYYLAIRPPERRRVKPAIDTVVERGADALVGVILLVAIHAIGVELRTLAALIAVAAALWLGVLLVLNREYVRAFRESLVSRWMDPEAASSSLRTPEIHNALLQALADGTERQLVMALRLVRRTRDARVSDAVRTCARSTSPAVRAAALRAMATLRLPEPIENLRRDVGSGSTGLRRAAVEHALTAGPVPREFAAELLDSPDLETRALALDALAERPEIARQVLRREWAEVLLASQKPEERALAAQALGLIGDVSVQQQLFDLAADTGEALEVRRAALRAVARRSNRHFLGPMLEALTHQDLSAEAEEALAALGDRAVPSLREVLKNHADSRVRRAAAATLARISGPRAVDALAEQVRSSDQARRYVGLRMLNRVRRNRHWRVLPRSLVHKTFARELRDYRNSVLPALWLEKREEPELQLLRRSFRESADRALDRACRALACWYDPYPLRGVYEGLRSEDREQRSRALEYLSHVVPAAVFRPLQQLLEEGGLEDAAVARAGETEERQAIRIAWESPEDWLRACAVRAARVLRGYDLSEFVRGPEDGPLAAAELEALEQAPRRAEESRQDRGAAPAMGARPAWAAERKAC